MIEQELQQLSDIITEYETSLKENNENSLYDLLRKSVHLYSEYIPQLNKIFDEVFHFSRTIESNSKTILSLLKRHYERERDNTILTKEHLKIDKKNIFIVHGKDESMLSSVKNAIVNFGLNPIVLKEQPNGGKTIIEKFEKNTKMCGFAIILMSDKDDFGYVQGHPDECKPRARQNVILEMGYFVGKLGREKHICILKKEKVEEPSDILGLVYTKFDEENQWITELKNELIYAGYSIE